MATLTESLVQGWRILAFVQFAGVPSLLEIELRNEGLAYTKRNGDTQDR
ncbi:MAG: hypothetical protein WA632_00570 [Gallionella sp.]